MSMSRRRRTCRQQHPTCRGGNRLPASSQLPLFVVLISLLSVVVNGSRFTRQGPTLTVTLRDDTVGSGSPLMVLPPDLIMRFASLGPPLPSKLPQCQSLQGHVGWTLPSRPIYPGTYRPSSLSTSVWDNDTDTDTTPTTITSLMKSRWWNRMGSLLQQCMICQATAQITTPLAQLVVQPTWTNSKENTDNNSQAQLRIQAVPSPKTVLDTQWHWPTRAVVPKLQSLSARLERSLPFVRPRVRILLRPTYTHTTAEEEEERSTNMDTNDNDQQHVSSSLALLRRKLSCQIQTANPGPTQALLHVEGNPSSSSSLTLQHVFGNGYDNRDWLLSSSSTTSSPRRQHVLASRLCLQTWNIVYSYQLSLNAANKLQVSVDPTRAIDITWTDTTTSTTTPRHDTVLYPTMDTGSSLLHGTWKTHIHIPLTTTTTSNGGRRKLQPQLKVQRSFEF